MIPLNVMRPYLPGDFDCPFFNYIYKCQGNEVSMREGDSV